MIISNLIGIYYFKAESVNNKLGIGKKNDPKNTKGSLRCLYESHSVFNYSAEIAALAVFVRETNFSLIRADLPERSRK